MFQNSKFGNLDVLIIDGVPYFLAIDCAEMLGYKKPHDAVARHGMKICGWALNSEYFCTIMHLLRDDISYRAIVDQLIEVPDDAYTRDTESVKRIATAYLKLLFPHVKTPADVSAREFKHYCLAPACKMRRIIRMQISMFDSSYNSELPQFTIRKIEE